MTERNTTQEPILKYAKDIGWEYVNRKDAEKYRYFSEEINIQEKARSASRFFVDIFYQKVKEFNQKYSDTKENLIGKLDVISNDIKGNRDFLAYLQGEKTFYCEEEKRELNLKLIDYNNHENNIYQVTDEYYLFNGHYGNREDIVFLINGIPIAVVECKSATKDEAIAIGIDQIRRYHRETPEMMVPKQIFTVTQALGFSYGITWNTVRRNIFNWKEKTMGDLEGKVKSFFAKERILAFIKDYIIFAEKDEELNKYILHQHQVEAVEIVIDRVKDVKKYRGLIWHTQGSGKTYTMIKVAEMLFKAPESEKPTILMLIDRNELEDQLIRNLESVGIEHAEKADSIGDLNKLLKNDFRGIIVSTIHKFRDMSAKINERKNIYVLVDEAHRTTQGDLGNFLMAAIPNATFIGFSGTPIDKTKYGKGTFKTFGIDDKKGYLHKYSIADSITDGTTLPLYYSLAPNELRVPEEVLEKEFLSLAELQGVSDIEELNKVLEKAATIRNFLKGDKRIDKIAEFVAGHYKENVEPLGYKAFLVAVDREACALYKKALDKFLPANYSTVVYTGSNNDSELLKQFHLSHEKEKEVRKVFAKQGTDPKILIVTEKLLTGYDAPVLYAMYLDKPMRDHTLLQTIARVNRPYENEEKNMKKPHGFVLDFIGIFDNLEKALAFDSEEISSVIKDIGLLKTMFQKDMKEKVPSYLELVKYPFTDKEVGILIEHFKDNSKRKEFFRFYKELESLYEIISPDAFLRPYMDNYRILSEIYFIVRNAFANRVYVDREFLNKTCELMRQKVDIDAIEGGFEIFEIDGTALKKITSKHTDDSVKVINLVKSILKYAEENSGDLFLISLAQKAKEIQEAFENRQKTTQDTLDALMILIAQEEDRMLERNKKGFDGFTYFVYGALREKNISNPEDTAKQIKEAFSEFPNWQASDQESRDLRTELYSILNNENENKSVDFVKYLFELFEKASNI